jgi:hypothetical protein
MNRFGGRFKYSKVLQLIDRVDNAITSNITKVKIRRDMKVLKNQFAQYELCFGNKFHVNPNGLILSLLDLQLLGKIYRLHYRCTYCLLVQIHIQC